MGKINIIGEAKRTVPADKITFSVEFFSDSTIDKSPKKFVLDQCEDFLKLLESEGYQIDQIRLDGDKVSRGYRDDEEVIYAKRWIEFDMVYNTKEVNRIVDHLRSKKWQIEYYVDFGLSDEEGLREELLTEALKDAERKAEIIAKGAGCSVKKVLLIDLGDDRRGSKPSCKGLMVTGMILNDDELASDSLATPVLDRKETVRVRYNIG